MSEMNNKATKQRSAENLEALFKSGWVAQATRLCRRATRPTKWEETFFWRTTRILRNDFSPFRAASRQPARASCPFHPFLKHALSFLGFFVVGVLR